MAKILSKEPNLKKMQADSLADGLRHIAQDHVFDVWPEAREELNNAADILYSEPFNA